MLRHWNQSSGTRNESEGSGGAEKINKKKKNQKQKKQDTEFDGNQ